ncbi:ATP-binding protein [Candidatus Methanoprimaticola sp. MG2]|uniref:ATP-binding protein n=1 Tax=Candidatus Methanoprimaticola sp. MG2 TaxID=3228838 RepID=UPI0039C69536
MRISRVRIGSFGGIRERDYRFDEGMTVMYGPNESGKTSTMEFIRSVLSPTNKRAIYPERRKSDTGTLHYSDADGDGTLELEHRKVSGDVPGCIPKDSELYRQIFAMDQRSLDDSKMIEQGELKSRFLTIPGGEAMDKVRQSIEDGERTVLGQRSNSSSELNTVNEGLRNAEASVSTLKAKVGLYGDLSAEIRAKRSELDGLNERMGRESEERARSSIVESNRANYEALRTLRQRRSDLGRFHEVSDGDISTKASLESGVRSAGERVEEVEGRIEAARIRLQGLDRRKVAARGEEIDRLPGLLNAYMDNRRELERPIQTTSVAGTRRSDRSMAAMILGMVLIVTGIVLAVVVHPVAGTVSVVGAGMAVLSMRRGGTTAQMPTDTSRRDRLEDEARGFERHVAEICSFLGMPFTDAEAAVRRLVSVRDAARECSSLDTPLMGARMAHSDANAKLAEFHSRFGGEAGFEESRRKTVEAGELDAGIQQLCRALSNAGLDPDVEPGRIEPDDDGLSGAVQQLSKEIGGLEEQRRAVLNDSEVEQAMDHLAVLRHRQAEIMMEGARIMIMKEIVDRACGRAFSDVQPDVASTAARYLRSMTGGRYDLEIDPLGGQVLLRGPDGPRGMSQWSSGLRAQALLSIKLAIAKELGSGEVPVVLDDVLLPFDSERKAGAVRALKGISEEMQVILFTCDSETRDISLSEGIRVLAV